MLSTLLGAKLGAALAAGVVSFGGVAAAAYTGVLPDALQDAAHNSIGAPAADHGKAAEHVKTAETTKETPVGPDVTGPAAFGLCTAWSHAKDSGNAAEKSIAFRNLATAAKADGADAAGAKVKIDAYCALVSKPAANGTDTAAKPDTAGKPSTAGKPATAGQSGVTPGTAPGASHRP